MQPTLLPLTALRFFAAAAVVLFHRPRAESFDAWLPYERHGAAGVTFFFLLSGFVLAYTYHDRLLARRPGSVRDFYTARLARILPAYLLAFVVSLWASTEGAKLLSLKFGGAPWKALAYLTLTQAWVPDREWYNAFNGPAWSLSAEWFFYLVFPLLLFGLATGPLWRRATVFAVASAAWAVMLGAWLWAPTDSPAWLWPVYVFPLARVLDFACGVALGVLFVRLKPAVGAAEGRAYWLWGVAEVGALVALWVTVHFCPVWGATDGLATLRIQLLTAQGYYTPAFALVVWLGALGRGPVSRLLSWSPLVYLGELSYGVYIFHFPIMILTANQLIPFGAPLGARVWEVMAVTGGATLALAALSFHFWEAPVRRWVRGRPKPVVADVVPPLRRAA